ncbi:MAG: hypothetical protein RR066_01535 [Mucinivorans sp.]
MMRYRRLFVLLLSLPLGAMAQKPTISTAITADTVWIGDQVEYQLTIDKDVAQEISLPQFENNKMTEQIEIVGTPRVDTLEHVGRRVKVRVNYTITSFDAGTFILRGFPVVAGTDTLFTPTVNELVVKTFEIDTTKQQIFDIKEPIDTPLIFAEIKDWVIYGSLGALALGVLIYFIIRYIKNRKKALAEKAKEPAHIIAIRELVLLDHQKLWQAGNFKGYYSTLSDILRTYLQNRYGFSAREMTTPEITAEVEQINEQNLFHTITELLTLADLVKFAKWTPSPLECTENYHAAYNYVESTKLIADENSNNNN